MMTTKGSEVSDSAITQKHAAGEGGGGMRAVHWNFPVATQEAQLPGSFEKHHILVFQILRWIVGFWRPTATKIDQLVTEVLVDDPHSMAVGHGLDAATQPPRCTW